MLVIATAVTDQGRLAVRTALFIPQLLPSIPINPQIWVTRDPIKQQITFPLANDKSGTADLYIPGGSGKHGAVLFFMGVVPPKRDEERITRLADGLARSGIAVMIPWLETQAQQRIVVEDVDSLVRAFQHLLTLDQVDPNRAGLGGICTGASMVTVAAQDKRIRHQVKFVNFFAGYYDALDLVKAIGSRTRFYDSETQPWHPDKLTLNLFSTHLIEGVTDINDRALLTKILEDNSSYDSIDSHSLSAEGMAVYRMMQGTTVNDVEIQIKQLSPKTKQFLKSISPSSNIHNLKARVFLMHDREDRLVPSEESRRLAEALGPNSNTHHTEFSSFQEGIQVHMDSTKRKKLGSIGYTREALKLFMSIYNMMDELS